MRLSIFFKSAIRLTLLSFCCAFLFEAKPAAAVEISIVADGLDNVRGLNFAPDGSLYITESGIGGDGRCIPGPSLSGLLSCVGTSGALTQVKDGNQERVLTGLPSIALRPNGEIGTGPQDIVFDQSGNPYLLIGYGGSPSISDFAEDSPSWGQLYQVDLETGSLNSIADLARYELANNPDGEDVLDVSGEIASNPYAFTIKGDTAYIVDAASNNVLTVGLDGNNLQTLTVLPTQTITDPIFPTLAPGQTAPPDAPQMGETPQEIEIQSVPTGVAFGLNGDLYVSEYTGFPFPVGKARIFRVEPDGTTTVYADGFTQLIDLDFDSSGNLYALQYANQPEWEGVRDGSLIQISPDGTRRTILSGNGLESATALIVGLDDAIYISNRGDVSGEGQVLRIDIKRTVPEPTSLLSILMVAALGINSFLPRQRSR